MKSITTSADHYEITKEQIVTQQRIVNRTYDLADAQEGVAAFAKLAAGKKYPLLVISDNKNGMTREARAYFMSDFLAEHTPAVALYTESKIMKLVGSFFLGLNKTPYPFRLFDDKKAALEWLKGYVECVKKS